MSPDKKILIQKIAVAALALVFIVNLIQARRRIHQSLVPSAEVLEQVFIIGEEEYDMASAVKKDITYEGESFRNPLKRPLEIVLLEEEGFFRGPGVDMEEAMMEGERLILEGIIWGGEKNFAIISGQVVVQGEIVNNAKVLNITKDRVMLMKDGSRIELRMKR